MAPNAVTSLACSSSNYYNQTSSFTQRPVLTLSSSDLHIQFSTIDMQFWMMVLLLHYWIIFMEEGRLVFSSVADRVSRLSLFYQILQYQETRLQLNSFQLDKLLPERALHTYDRLIGKHQRPGDFNFKRDVWYESEKRLFAWFMAFYSYLERDGQSIKVTLRLFR